MLEIVDNGCINLCENVTFAPLKCNKMWGCEYLLMDSNALGGIDGSMYDPIIDMYMNIWNLYDRRHFFKNSMNLSF